MIIPHYQDVPLKMLRAEPGASHPIGDDAVLIYPRGTATAVVDIPPQLQGHKLTIHSRSTAARWGLHVTSDSNLLNSRYEIGIVLENWAYYGLVIRGGDTLLFVANTPEIREFPLVEAIALHAADKFLWVNIGVFPYAHISDGCTPTWSVPYLDPHNMPQYGMPFKEWHYDSFALGPDEFFVIAAEENPNTPNDCFGIVEPATSKLQHASAVLDKPGSNGKRALEFRTLRACCIQPGMHVATLKIYRSPIPLLPYTGAYNGRNSIVPLYI